MISAKLISVVPGTAKWREKTLDLLGNSVSYRASLAIFQAKALQNRVLFSGYCSETEVSEQFYFTTEADMADDFTFEITKNCGEISKSKGGWTLELNMVSWGGRDPKYDLRSWSPDHQKMGKGVTLSKDELVVLRELLNKTVLD